MSQSHPVRLNRVERLLRLLTVVRAGEGRCVLLFAAHAFLIMAAYYLIKALRESFLLGQTSAEVRSYAVALNGGILMLVVPLYSALRRHVNNVRLVQMVTLFFAGNLIIFLLLYPLRASWFGAIFFIWVGLFGVILVAQFWALAAGSFNTKSGQRLFPAIMLGSTIGALAGAQVTALLIGRFGPATLLGLGALVLASTALLVRPELRAIPHASESRDDHAARTTPSLAGGFRVVFGDRYLVLVALFVVLLNCIGSTGDYLLASLVQQHAVETVTANPALSREAVIGGFYASYQFWLTLVGVVLQMFFVSRIYRLVGVRGAVLVLPIMALFVYGAIAFVPIFSMIWIAKIAESATNYSLMSTTQQALYLPTSPVAKYDGKMTIDTFFWRLGDIIQAGLVYIGLHHFALSFTGFAILNAVLAACWIALALAIGRRYVELVRTEVANTPPVAKEPLPDLGWQPGVPFEYALAPSAFYDADPGDVLRFHAKLDDGEGLPHWLRFDGDCGILNGCAPEEAPARMSLQITAFDMDGAKVSTLLVLFRA